jgi:lipid-A-disaccharide synthase-like uncharacterized protein
MSFWLWIGWLGNACFFSRFLVQWLRSERAGKSVAPRSFWWLSLAGTFLLFAYTFYRGEVVLLVGYTVNALIYFRNLQLASARGGGRQLTSRALAATGLLAVAALIWAGVMHMKTAPLSAPLWLAIGIVGQSVWCSRFVLQWIATERAGESHFPRAFWWVSLAGNVLLLTYAIHLGDPVWIAGLAIGPLVQARNLMLMYKRPRASSEQAVSEPEPREPAASPTTFGPARPSH